MEENELHVAESAHSIFSGVNYSFAKYRYRILKGGRSSTKTNYFALMVAFRGMVLGRKGHEGLIVCGRSFKESLGDSSFPVIAEMILKHPVLNEYWEVGDRYIRSRDKRIKFSFYGVNININSIKGKNKILIFWIDEAEDMSEEAFQVIDPTVRTPVSEIYISLNQKKKSHWISQRFIENNDPNAIVKHLTYRDNPWHHLTGLERLRVQQKKTLPPNVYNWIWEGDYLEGSTNGILDEHDFKYYDEPQVFEEVVAVFDTAASTEENAAKSSLSLFGINSKGIHVLHVSDGKFDMDELLSQSAKFIKDFKQIKYVYNPILTDVFIENKSTGISLVGMLKKRGMEVIKLDKLPKGESIRGRDSEDWNELIGTSKKQYGLTAKSERAYSAKSKLRGDVDEATEDYINRKHIHLPLQPTKYTDAAWVTSYKDEILSCSADSSSGYWDNMDTLVYGILIFIKDQSSDDVLANFSSLNIEF